MLFYLGPELIAALLGAYEGIRENSQASCGLTQPSVDERDVTPSPISPSSLPCLPRTKRATRQHLRTTPSKLISECLSDHRNFQSGAKQVDDLTPLVIRRTG